MGIIKTAFCRIFHGVMKLGNYCLGYRIPEKITGPGCVNTLPEKLIDRGFHHVFLVTDEGLLKLGLPNGLMQAMDKAGLAYTVFSRIQPNPTDENVEEGLSLFLESGSDVIVAFGGGSPMDCAKGIAARKAQPRKNVAQLQGVLRVHRRIVPLWAVPTTAGTGSETTVAAVITIAATKHKASINDPVLMPLVAVLDPELTMGLPPQITATTGMDALCHAVESYTNGMYCTKLENDYAKKAVRLIHDNLYEAYSNGSNLEARQAMQEAAFYAGRSFTRGCVGYVHAVGHTLGGLYGVPHGLAMSVILPHVLRQFGPAVQKKLAELADVCGMTGTESEKAEAFIRWIEEMKKKMNIPAGIDRIQEQDIQKIIRWADREANPLYPVPVVWDEKDFRKLINTIRNA